MANISNLLQKLRERIASSSSASSASASSSAPGADEDPIEVDFRAVLVNLLQAYVNPSSAANEREATAVLRLLSQSARMFPGVLYHGRAAAVLPVIGRLLPFLADPSFCSLHGVIFETISSLLSLLRTGEREAYRQFFLDTMVAIEDVLYVASLHANKLSSAHADSVTIKCLSSCFEPIANSPTTFSELPANFRPRSGTGVLVDLTGNARWRPFAVSLIKFVSTCLTEGTLYVEGLLDISFVTSACSLLCYGDADLHMVGWWVVYFLQFTFSSILMNWYKIL